MIKMFKDWEDFNSHGFSFLVTCDKCNKSIKLNEDNAKVVSNEIVKQGWIVWFDDISVNWMHVCPDCKIGKIY